MAVSPDELKDRISCEDAVVVARLEKAIDGELEQQVATGKTPLVDLLKLFGGRAPRKSVISALIAKYHEVGWRVVEESGEDQREGPWLNLRFHERGT